MSDSATRGPTYLALILVPCHSGLAADLLQRHPALVDGPFQQGAVAFGAVEADQGIVQRSAVVAQEQHRGGGEDLVAAEKDAGADLLAVEINDLAAGVQVHFPHDDTVLQLTAAVHRA